MQLFLQQAQEAHLNFLPGLNSARTVIPVSEDGKIVVVSAIQICS